MVISVKEYSEVYAVLKMMGEKYINKIPPKLFYHITEAMDENYHPKYNKDTPLYKQKIEKASLTYIFVLHHNYWCDSEKDKEKNLNILIKNEENNQKRLHELYNYDKLFQNKDKTEKNQNCIVEYKENIWTRISKFFKKLFWKNVPKRPGPKRTCTKKTRSQKNILE